MIQVFLDIGAGIGFFSLTAASRGQQVHAFELASKSIASIQASIEYNGFGELITLRQVGPWQCSQPPPSCIATR